MKRERNKPANDNNTNDCLRYREASIYTGIGLPTLYALVHQQRIPHIRLSGRLVLFSKRALDSWLAQHAVPAIKSTSR